MFCVNVIASSICDFIIKKIFCQQLFSYFVYFSVLTKKHQLILYTLHKYFAVAIFWKICNIIYRNNPLVKEDKTIRTTLKDIASAAGVSIGTVERALKHKGRINPAVAEHIRALAEEMNYQPNIAASGLVRKSNVFNIAVIFSVEPNDFWKSVIAGINRASNEIQDYGFQVKLYFGHNFDSNTQISLIDRVLQEGANGIIIVPINASEIVARINSLWDEKIPVVFLNSKINHVNYLSAIHCDYYRTGRIAGVLMQQFSKDESNIIGFIPSSIMLNNNFRIEGIRDSFANDTQHHLAGIYELTSEAHKDLKIVSEQLTKHNDVSGIIYNGDISVLINAMKQTSQSVNVICFDLVEETKTALLAGQVKAVITQSQEEQGYIAVKTIFQYVMSGIEPEKDIVIESGILIKECIDDIKRD